MKYQFSRNIFLVSLFCIAQITSINAAPPGSLDAAFGNGGQVSTYYPYYPPWIGTSAYSNATAVQSDGKILVAGTLSCYTCSDSEFFVARYNRDGSLDTAFDVDGVVVVNIAPLPWGWGSEDQANAIALQPDGKILVAGSTIDAAAQFAVVRLNINGSLDTTFDGDGKVTTSVGNHSYATGAYSVVVHNNKILVGGQAIGSSSLDFAAVRYNIDGSLDTSFGSGGVRIVDINVGSHDTARSVMLHPSGNVVLAGSSGADFAVARLDPNGVSLDTTFGKGGIVITSIRSSDSLRAAVMLSQDVIAAGCSDGDFALVRYDRYGNLYREEFGIRGIVLTKISRGACSHAVRITADWKIVAAGHDGNGDFALARYGVNGVLDSTWGSQGIVTTDFVQYLDTANALAIQADGKVIAAGTSVDGNISVIAVSRYLAGP